MVAAFVALGEIPDPVPACVDAGHDRCPCVRREGVRRRAEHSTRSEVAQTCKIRELSGGQHGIDHVERRRVEADDGQVWTGHPRTQPLQVRNHPTETRSRGMRPRGRGEASHSVSVKTCPNCGQATRDDDRFCPSCGQPTDPRRPARWSPTIAPAARLPAPPRRSAGVRAGSSAVLVGTRHRGGFRALRRALRPLLDQPLPAGLRGEGQDQLDVRVPPARHERRQPALPHKGPSGSQPTGDDGRRDRGESAAETPVSSPPDLNTIVRNANTFPYIIESDQVADYREREYGVLTGSLKASGHGGRHQPRRVSKVPVIRLIATAGTPEEAASSPTRPARRSSAGSRTSRSRRRFRGGPDHGRAAHGAQAAVASAGPSTTLPLLVFVVVFGAFCVLAILLDRLVPPGQPRPARSDVEPLEPVKVKKTA